MLSFFPRGVLDKLLNLIESVSDDFPSYSTLFVFTNFSAKCNKVKLFTRIPKTKIGHIQMIRLEKSTSPPVNIGLTNMQAR